MDRSELDAAASMGTKFKISAKRRRDVGTPFTVDQLIDPKNSEYRDLLPDKDELTALLGRVPQDKKREFRRLLIEGYLLGTDYVSPLWVQRYDGQGKPIGGLEQTGKVQDSYGTYQLGGEMRRYWINAIFIYDPRHWNFPIDTSIISHYCNKHDLPNSAPKFVKKLGIKP